MKIYVVASLTLFALLACTNNHNRYHDGVYVYTDTSQQSIIAQEIKVDGKWMYHTIQSSKEKSNFKEYKSICIQYPYKITLPLQDGHSVVIEIDSAGNLSYDGHLFIKEPIRIVDPMPIPKTFQESRQ